ncbi:MAG TPA: toll/interleukin-1 receptor domain-containing protein, partial [Terriglobales bacterium]|nr:toll/interleukin-1 receptor domain-containing protein [Terriglobales bacterium]
MKVFLSYSRADAAVAATIGEDVRQMGHAVWYDREVTGGQSWWNAILGQIRDCDLFIFVLTPHSLDSQACRCEYSYASALRKRILPVLCQDGVKINLLPPELSVIQFVDYRGQDKQAAFALVKSLQDVPQAVPLPNPLPAEPPVPLSYLGDLRAQIE